MSNPTSQDWLLKVIAGPHQGAELLLEPKQTLVGSDDECDVVFHDVLVAPQHVSFVIEAGVLYAEPLGGRVYINGKRVREARQKVDEFSFVTVGGTHMVLGREKSQWPLLSAADLPDLEKDAPEPAAAAESIVGNESSSKEEDTVEKTQSEIDAEPQNVPNKKAAWFMVGVGCLLLFGSLYAWHRLNQVGITGSLGNIVDRELTLKEKAEQILSDVGVDHDVRIEQSGDRVTATGYVKSDDVSRELQAKLRNELPGIRTRIWSLDRIANSARNMLAQLKLNLQVEGLPEGELKISGKVNDTEAWERAKQMIANEIPGVSNIVDQVQSRQQPISVKSNPEVVEKVVERIVPVTIQTRESASAPNPSEATVAQAWAPVKNIGTSRGAPPQTRISGDKAAVANGVPVAADFEKDSAPTATEPEDARSIQFIQESSDDFGWVKLDDGSVLFLGAKLKDGSTLVEISKSNITVLIDGEKRVVKLGEPITKFQKPVKSASSNRVE